MSQGKCYICGNHYSDKGICRHIGTCIADRYGSNPASQKVDGTYLLKVQDKYCKEFYLFLLADMCVRLDELDQYLKDIWLECCGHLSSYKIDGVEYDCDPDSSWDQAEDMDIALGDVLEAGMSFSYTYDFGSSTILTLRVLAIYEPFHDEKGIHLAGRNLRPSFPCSFCKNEAIAMYENLYDGENGVVCKDCMEKMQEKDEDISFSDMLNSPRAGVCGYGGPDDDILFMKHKKSNKKQKGKKQPASKGSATQGGISPLLDKLINGETIKADVELENILPRIMDNFDYNNHQSLPPFMISNAKLKGDRLSDYLGQLRKTELDSIRNHHKIEGSSGLKKDKLILCLNDYILNKLEDILAFIPESEYLEVLDFVEEGNMDLGPDEEIPEDLDDLISLGILYNIDTGDGETKLILPEEIRKKIKSFISGRRFIEKRELSTRIECTFIGVFFYWGIIRKPDLFNEAVKHLGSELGESLANHMGEVFRYMLVSYIEKASVGNCEFFSMFPNEPVEMIMSEGWQKAQYPLITRDMMSFSKEGWLGFIMANPHFRMMYDVMMEYEDIQEDEEYNEDTILEFIMYLYDYVTNTKPDTTVEQLGAELKLGKDFEKSLEIKDMIKGMLQYSPNYWLKGNAISGTIHVISSDDLYNQAKGGKTEKSSEKAAEKWKIGRNDPCPCGSGKKYKKCCLGSQ